VIPDGERPHRRSHTGLGARISAARRDAGLTQRKLADLAGVRLWLVDQWESEARAPSEDKLEAVAKATGKTTHWLETGLVEAPVDQRRDRQPEHRAPEQPSVAEGGMQVRDAARSEALLRESRRELERAHAEAEALRVELAHLRAQILSAPTEDAHPALSQTDSANGGSTELAAMAHWLTQTVREAAKREAEGIIAAAREEARRMLAHTEQELETPQRNRGEDEHADDSGRS
jgi:transcriptional regulator with XRE-family HTH domain